MKSHIVKHGHKLLIFFLLFCGIVILLGILIGVSSTRLNTRGKAQSEETEEMTCEEYQTNAPEPDLNDCKNPVEPVSGPCIVGDEKYHECTKQTDTKLCLNTWNSVHSYAVKCFWNKDQKRNMWYVSNKKGECVEKVICNSKNVDNTPTPKAPTIEPSITPAIVDLIVPDNIPPAIFGQPYSLELKEINPSNSHYQYQIYKPYYLTDNDVYISINYTSEGRIIKFIWLNVKRKQYSTFPYKEVFTITTTNHPRIIPISKKLEIEVLPEGSSIPYVSPTPQLFGYDLAAPDVAISPYPLQKDFNLGEEISFKVKGYNAGRSNIIKGFKYELLNQQPGMEFSEGNFNWTPQTTGAYNINIRVIKEYIERPDIVPQPKDIEVNVLTFPF